MRFLSLVYSQRITHALCAVRIACDIKSMLCIRYAAESYYALKGSFLGMSCVIWARQAEYRTEPQSFFRIRMPKIYQSVLEMYLKDLSAIHFTLLPVQFKFFSRNL